MKNGNVVLIILAVIVVLSGVGCTSLPRQKNVSLITPALPPQVMVAPPAPPALNNEQYLIGGVNERNDAEENGQQSLFGGFGFNENENETIIVQSPQPENRIAVAPTYKQSPQRPHVHRPYPVSGQIWAYECYDCLGKLGLAPSPMSQSIPWPRTYSQPLSQQSSYPKIASVSAPPQTQESSEVIPYPQFRGRGSYYYRQSGGNSNSFSKEWWGENWWARYYSDSWYNWSKTSSRTTRSRTTNIYSRGRFYGN